MACKKCGGTEHAIENCPHSGFSTSCKKCGSAEHAIENCPHSGFSTSCKKCGSTEHAIENCPHRGFSTNCKKCGSTEHTIEDCPHRGFSTSCKKCGSTEHTIENCPYYGSSSRHSTPRDDAAPDHADADSTSFDDRRAEASDGGLDDTSSRSSDPPSHDSVVSCDGGVEHESRARSSESTSDVGYVPYQGSDDTDYEPYKGRIFYEGFRSVITGPIFGLGVWLLTWVIGGVGYYIYLRWNNSESVVDALSPFKTTSLIGKWIGVAVAAYLLIDGVLPEIRARQKHGRWRQRNSGSSSSVGGLVTAGIIFECLAVLLSTVIPLAPIFCVASILDDCQSRQPVASQNTRASESPPSTPVRPTPTASNSGGNGFACVVRPPSAFHLRNQLSAHRSGPELPAATAVEVLARTSVQRHETLLYEVRLDDGRTGWTFLRPSWLPVWCNQDLRNPP